MRRKQEKTGRKGLKIFGIIVLILVILLVLIVGSLFIFINNKLSKIKRVDIDEKDLNVS